MGNVPKKSLILNALALAMGVAGIVLTILGESAQTASILYGIAIFALAINALEKNKK
jgi:hypothetical protein